MNRLGCSLGALPLGLVIPPDTTPPTITSSASVSVAENAQLAHDLTASEAVNWTIRTSAQNAASVDYTHFEISGSTLRWLSNGAKDYEVPGDTGSNNTYVVVVRATDWVSNTADQTITVTVTDVADGAWGAGSASGAGGASAVGAATVAAAGSAAGTGAASGVGGSGSAGSPLGVLLTITKAS